MQLTHGELLTHLSQRLRMTYCHLILFFGFGPSFHLCLVSRKSDIVSLDTGISIKLGNQRTNGPVALLRPFVLSKFMVTFLKNETV